MSYSDFIIFKKTQSVSVSLKNQKQNNPPTENQNYRRRDFQGSFNQPQRLPRQDLEDFIKNRTQWQNKIPQILYHGS